MNKFRIIIFSDPKDFINSLDKSRRAKVDKIYYLFEDYDKRDVHNVSRASASKFTCVMAHSNMQT